MAEDNTDNKDEITLDEYIAQQVQNHANGKVKTQAGTVPTTEYTFTSPKTSVTEKDDSVENTYTRSPFIKEDGTPDKDMEAFYNENYKKPLQRNYGINPYTGKYKGSISDLLGFDPYKYKAELEEKAKLDNFRKKEAGFKSALSVITDIATAGAGGNVYKREKDKTAEEADKRVDAYKDTIRDVGMAVNKAKKGQEAAYLAASSKAMDDFIKTYGIKVKQTKGGGSTTTTQGGNTIKTGVKVLPAKGTRVSVGGGKSELPSTTDIFINRKVKDGSAGYYTYNVPTDKALGLASRLATLYGKYLYNYVNFKNKRTLKQELIEAGVLVPNSKLNSNNKEFFKNAGGGYSFDYNAILKNGAIYSFPDVHATWEQFFEDNGFDKTKIFTPEESKNKNSLSKPDGEDGYSMNSFAQQPNKRTVTGFLFDYPKEEND